ncbi:MAG: CpsB/CapC family capsule biosynthesis tyrosine phosphatase [Acidobacteriota bacterium]
MHEDKHFIDIHTHILPGVDDGSVDIEETIVMLQIAYDSGTRGIVATPHMFLDLFKNNDFLEIRDRFDRFKEELEPYHSTFPFLREMDVYLGAENYASVEFLEALDQGCVLTLNGSRYLLLEVPFSSPFRQIEAFLERILATDYLPVIAHVERYAAVQEDPLRLEPLWRRGCVVQVNARSLAGSSGSRPKNCAEKLIQAGVLDVIATDGHRPRWRPPDLQGVYLYLEKEYGREDALRWMTENPRMILANQRLDAART